jgi:hypothetical protein
VGGFVRSIEAGEAAADELTDLLVTIFLGLRIGAYLYLRNVDFVAVNSGVGAERMMSDDGVSWSFIGYLLLVFANNKEWILHFLTSPELHVTTFFLSICI